MNLICNNCSGPGVGWALKHRAGTTSVFFSSCATSVPTSGEREEGRIPDVKAALQNGKMGKSDESDEEIK